MKVWCVSWNNGERDVFWRQAWDALALTASGAELAAKEHYKERMSAEPPLEWTTSIYDDETEAYWFKADNDEHPYNIEPVEVKP